MLADFRLFANLVRRIETAVYEFFDWWKSTIFTLTGWL